MNELSKKLIAWFLTYRRELPWRNTINPYRVWVSEVMLQQTQVSTVIPYFKRWMDLFPTLESLANSPLTIVLKAWEGLGYYSRARNLHRGAQQVMEKYQGRLPSDEKSLLEISGIGPYTCSAIRSFAFQEKCSLIDGNVKRVISRLFELNLDFSKLSDYNTIKGLLDNLIPEKDHWIFNEALMELGALICSPQKPLCLSCPLQKDCGAFTNSHPEDFPLKKERKKTIYLHRLIFLFQHESEILLKQESSKLMKDLYQFFYTEAYSSFELDLSSFSWASYVKQIESLPFVKHAYTHHQVTLYPYWIKLHQKILINGHEWLSISDAKTKAFSAGHRKIFEHLLKLI